MDISLQNAVRKCRTIGIRQRNLARSDLAAHRVHGVGHKLFAGKGDERLDNGKNHHEIGIASSANSIAAVPSRERAKAASGRRHVRRGSTISAA